MSSLLVRGDLVNIAQNDTGNNGAGALAFLVVGALFIAAWFLYRSLRRQLGRIDFDESVPHDTDHRGTPKPVPKTVPPAAADERPEPDR